LFQIIGSTLGLELLGRARGSFPGRRNRALRSGRFYRAAGRIAGNLAQREAPGLFQGAPENTSLSSAGHPVEQRTRVCRSHESFPHLPVALSRRLPQVLRNCPALVETGDDARRAPRADLAGG